MSFEYLKPASLEEAFHCLKQHEGTKLYAGGSDLLWQIREDTISPDYIVDLKGINGLNFIKDSTSKIEIGALTTLRDIENSGLIKQVYPAIAEAASNVASQKLRNRATIGGNLCQRLKCPYFNQSHINHFMRESIEPCFKRKGKVCHAVVFGEDNLHTIVGKSYCKAPVPSDMAIALAALGASAEVQSEDNIREIMIKDLYRADGEPTIKSHEIVTKINIPRKGKQGNTYLTYKPGPGCFAVVSVVTDVILDQDGKTCKDSEIYLGGVAQQPYRAEEVINFIQNKTFTPELIEESSKLLFQDVKITNNEVLFKVAKARDLCREALIKSWQRCREGVKA